jgi:hypothetical protein
VDEHGRKRAVLLRTVLDPEHAVILAVGAERDFRRRAHDGHAGEGGDAVDRLLVEARHPSRVGIRGVGERHAEGERVRRVEARPHRAQLPEAARHQPRRRQEHERERDLRHDQHLPRALPLPPLRRRAPPFAQHRREVAAAEPHDRKEAAEESHQHRHRERDGERRRVDSHRLDARNGHAAEPRQDSQADEGESDAEGAARRRQHQRFGDELPDHLGAPGAQRRAHRELALAALGPHQEEVGHVGAGRQQHEAYRPQDHPEHATDVADDVVAQRVDEHPRLPLLDHVPRRQPRRDFRIQLAEPHQRLLQVGRRALRRRPRPQAGNRVVVESGDFGLRGVDA